MYTEKTRIARHIGRKTRNTVISFHGPRMDRHGVRAVIGAMTPFIATLLLAPWRNPPWPSDQGTRHGFVDGNADRREGSP